MFHLWQCWPWPHVPRAWLYACPALVFDYFLHLRPRCRAAVQSSPRCSCCGGGVHPWLQCLVKTLLIKQVFKLMFLLDIRKIVPEWP